MALNLNPCATECTRMPMTKDECHAYDAGKCMNGFVCEPKNENYWPKYCPKCQSNENCDDCDGCRRMDGEPTNYEEDADERSD